MEEHVSHCEVAAVTWVGDAHHLFGIEHLLAQLWHGECTALLGVMGCE